MEDNTFQLYISGTKKGWKKFVSSDSLSLADNEFTDVRDIIELDERDLRETNVFYSMEYMKNNLLISIYRVIKDWGNRLGYYSVSLVFDENSFVERSSIPFLKCLSDNYWEKYIIKVGMEINQTTKGEEQLSAFDTLLCAAKGNIPSNTQHKVVVDGLNERLLQTEYELETDLADLICQLSSNKNQIKRIFFFKKAKHYSTSAYDMVDFSHLSNEINQSIYGDPIKLKIEEPKSEKTRDSGAYKPYNPGTYQPTPAGEGLKNKGEKEGFKDLRNKKAKESNGIVLPFKRKTALIGVLIVALVACGIIFYKPILNRLRSKSPAEVAENGGGSSTSKDNIKLDSSGEKAKGVENKGDIVQVNEENRNTERENRGTGQNSSEEFLAQIQEHLESTEFDLNKTEEYVKLGAETGLDTLKQNLDDYHELCKLVERAKEIIYFKVKSGKDPEAYNTKFYDPGDGGMTPEKVKDFFKKLDKLDSYESIKLSKTQKEELHIYERLVANMISATNYKRTLFEHIEFVLRNKNASEKRSIYRKYAKFFNKNRPDHIDRVDEKYNP